MSSEKIVVLITINSRDGAVKIAKALLEENLIACANIISQVRSLYKWKGEVCDDPEFLMICKSQRHLFDRLAQKVKSLHSYEVPEIIAMPLVEGWSPYLKWIEEETASD